MSEAEQNQDGQKTVVAFIVGLIIGGLLVWVFTSSPAESPATPNDDATEESSDSNSDNEGDESANESSETNSNGNGGATEQPAPEMNVGDASVSVSDQPAGLTVALDAVTFPADEGWIGVRSFSNGNLSGLLGVVLFSKERGLVPENIVLQSPTVTGREYAIVFYSESGDGEFSLADDVQMGDVFATFTAQ